MSARSRSLRQTGNRSLWLSVCVLLFSCTIGFPAELIVGFKPDATPADRTRATRNSVKVHALARGIERQNAASGGNARVEVLKLQPGVSADSEIARLELNPGVAYVEPNYAIKLFATPPAIVPNDFEFARQYSLQNTGANNGRTNADISAPKAWALATGGTNVVVAVIDTGVDYFHEDLQDNLWRNPREIPANGIDDDGNGYIDDAFGYDFVSDDSDPFDDNGHGTHVTGIIAARGNNNIGTAGICWTASVMAVKAFDEDGNGSVADAINAIHYAVENGARVINASWGIDEKSRALEEAMQYAADAGVLVIAAAGNQRTDAPAYPASFDSVLSVAATDNRDNRAVYSNYGATVDIAAPGTDVLSTLPENSYGIESGTSMAAPHVTGVAALVLSRYPKYTRQELFDILVNSVDSVLFDQPIGAGRLNAYLAVRMDQPLPIVRLSVPPILSGTRDILGTAMGSFFAGYQLRVGQGLYPTSWVALASSGLPITNALAGRIDSSQLPDGTAQVQLIVTNQNGLTGMASVSVRILNTYISSPASGDILRPGKFPVRGTVFGDGKSYELSVGTGLAPKEWQVLGTGSSSHATNVLLGEWDATAAPANFYSLRLVVTDRTGGRYEFLAPAVYIDRDLREGWPAYLPIDRDFPPTDWRNVRAADLDGDGKTELVLVDAGTKDRPQKLLVYSYDGQLKWSKVLGFEIPPDFPAIGDIDGDGKSEIFVDSTNGITAFHHDGSPVEGWPIVTVKANHAKVLADLDRDGTLELIAYSQEYAATQVGETRDLAVYRNDGTLVRKWELPWCGFTNAVQKISPAVANIDDDPELEIVVPSGCQEILAMDFRRVDPKWRASTHAPILSSPAIGDVDGRDGPDIVVGTAMQNGATEGGVYIWRGNGEPWVGFPVLEEQSFTTAPALADMDADGRLEIIVPGFNAAAIRVQLNVLQWDGFQAEGWPKTPEVSWFNSAAAADVNQDGKPDAIFTAPGYMHLSVSEGITRWVNGISAYDFSGSELRLSGNSQFKPRLLESATGRAHRAGPAVICDLDGDGIMDLVSSSLFDRAFGTYSRLKERSSVYAWNIGLPLRPESTAWPMYGHDLRNSSAYSLPIIAVPPPTNVTAAIRDRVLTIEDRPVRIEALRNDLGLGLRITGTTLPTNGLVALQTDGTLLYSPNTNASGFDTFNYMIASQDGRTSTGKIDILVRPVNDLPVVSNLDLTINKNASADFFFAGTDADGDALTYRITSTPLHGEAWNYPTVGSYYPRKGYSGFDSFSYVANDGKGDSAPATIQITILNSNNPPKAVTLDVITKTNRAVQIAGSGEDIDGDPLTYEIVSSPAHGQVKMEREAFLYLPNTNYIGPDSFRFRAFDGTAYSEAAAVNLSVIVTNIVPKANNGSGVFQPNSSNQLRLTATDPDGDALEFTVLTSPLHGRLDGTPPDLRYVPEKDYEGPDRFTFSVTDPFAESSPGTFNIRVERQNRPPEARDQTIVLAPDATTAISLDAFDPDGDPFQTIVLKGPAHGRVFGSGTNYTYRPAANFAGTDRFTYKLWDGKKFGKAAQVNMNIVPPAPENPLAFQALRLRNQFVELQIRAGTASSFTIESSTNLLDWSKVAGPIQHDGETQSYFDTNSTPARRFYRAVAQ